MTLAGARHGGLRQRAAQIANCAVSEILDFSASLNPLGPPASVRAAIIAALDSIADYPDPSYRDLKLAIANYYNLDPDWLVVGNGAAELFTDLGRQSSARGLTLLPEPGFRDYDRAVSGPIHYYEPTRPPLNPDAATLWLNNPHNPSGTLLSTETLHSLAAYYPALVVDEAFMDFVDPPISLMHTYLPQVAVVRSLTKFWAIPGLRLGFAVIHPDQHPHRDPWPVNSLAVAAARAALADTDFRGRSLAWLPPTRQHLFEQLVAIPGLTPAPSTANFLLVHSQQPVPQLQNALLRQHRILIRDCLSFRSLGEHYFRVAVRTETENQALITALTTYAATA